MNDEITLIAHISKNKYTLSFHYDNLASMFYVGIVKDKVKRKDDYAQIILSKEDVGKISDWLRRASTPGKIEFTGFFCTSLCEIIAFMKFDNEIYIQLYQQASYPRQRIGKNRDDFYLTEEESGVLGRELSVFIKTELK